jgi:hypothetical protein
VERAISGRAVLGILSFPVIALRRIRNLPFPAIRCSEPAMLLKLSQEISESTHLLGSDPR